LGSLTCLVLRSNRLGQKTPPSGFRAWKLPEIEAYSANLEAKLPALQRVVGLYAQLGQSRVDLTMAEWSVEKLKAHADTLATQVGRTYYISLFIYIFIYLCIYLSIDIYISIYLYIQLSISVSISLSVSIYVSLYICVYLYIYIYYIWIDR